MIEGSSASLPVTDRRRRPIPSRAASALGPLVALALLACLAGVAPPSLGGQEPVRETQIPLAPEEGILELSAELRSRLGLFPDVPGFVAARLFERPDGLVVLEIESRSDGRLVRERRQLSSQGLDELRGLLSSRLAEAGGARSLSREGRGGMVLGHTLLGIGFHGWAVPAALDIESTQASVAAYFLTAGATFLLPYRLTRDRAVTEAHRRLSMYGGTRGILYGILAADAVTEGEGESRNRARLGGGVIAGLGGSLLGFVAAERYEPDEGRAALWGVMGDVGLAAGATMAYAVGPYAFHTVLRDDLGFEYEVTERRNAALGHLMTLAGGAAGLLAGGWLGGREPYTDGNVNALRSAVILGAQTGVTLTRALGTEHARSLAAGGLLGAGAGLFTGNALLRGHRFSGGEGLLVNAGHLAGGATALGLTYLVVEEIEDNPVLYLSTSTLGSLLGAALVYRALGEGSAPPRGFGFGGSDSNVFGARGVTVRFHPDALLLSLGGEASPAPLVTIRF